MALAQGHMQGEQIGNYRVIERLGAGGMGVVYRAEDVRLKRAAAIKLLPPALSQNSEARARLEREAQAASALDHPNICTIYEIGEHGGQLYVAMAFYEGQTLRQKIDGGGLSRQEAARVAMQIAGALECAHEAGIVHRDVKPENIILVRRASETRGARPGGGEVKLLDFGLAKFGGALELTAPGTMTGTPAYMSPEQVNGEPADAGSDVWALGVICYEMLAGVRPFTGASMGGILNAILNRQPQRLGVVCPDLDPAVDQAIHRALEKDRTRRARSAGEIREAFEQSGRLGETATVAPEPAVPAAPATSAVGEKPGGSGSGNWKSLAVLPFADRSPGRDQGYFCEGLADELISNLARLNRFRVASRTACFQFGESANISDVGRQLNVDVVLEGSVRKAGQRLRVAVQLIDAGSGFCIWSDRYDRELKDVFEIQEDIAEQVVRGLVGTFEPEDRAALVAGSTDELEAYDCYLRGKLLYWQGRRQTLEAARRMFERAIAIDPGYALAYAGIAACGAWLYGDWGGSPSDLSHADETSRKAVSLAPTLAEAHVARAQVLALKEEFEAAERALQEALRLNPRSYEASYSYGWFCFRRGRLPEAAEHFRKAQTLRPEDFEAPSKLAMIYRSLGQSHEHLAARRRSLDRARRHLELSPDDARALYIGAIALFDLGEREQGLEWVTRAVSIDPEDLNLLYNVACAYAVAGEADLAIQSLERLFQQRFVNTAWLEQDSDLDPLRSDHRFQALLAQNAAAVEGAGSS